MPEQPSHLPLHLLQEGQNLVIPPECVGWLILQKPFYAEMIGPGSVVGGRFDLQCQALYTIGNVQVVSLGQGEQRQAAYQARVHYIQAIQQVLVEGDPIQRAHQLLTLLVEWVGLEQTQSIPHELLGRLGGVMPYNIRTALKGFSRSNLVSERELVSLAA